MPAAASAGAAASAERGGIERQHERVAAPEAERRVAAEQRRDVRAGGGDVGDARARAPPSACDGRDEARRSRAALQLAPAPVERLRARQRQRRRGRRSQLAPGPKARASGPERAPARAEARYSRGLDQARDQAPQAARSLRERLRRRGWPARGRGRACRAAGCRPGRRRCRRRRASERNGSLRPSSGCMPVSSGVSTAPIGPAVDRAVGVAADLGVDGAHGQAGAAADAVEDLALVALADARAAVVDHDHDELLGAVVAVGGGPAEPRDVARQLAADGRERELLDHERGVGGRLERRARGRRARRGSAAARRRAGRCPRSRARSRCRSRRP